MDSISDNKDVIAKVQFRFEYSHNCSNVSTKSHLASLELYYMSSDIILLNNEQKIELKCLKHYFVFISILWLD